MNNVGTYIWGEVINANIIMKFRINAIVYLILYTSDIQLNSFLFTCEISWVLWAAAAVLKEDARITVTKLETSPCSLGNFSDSTVRLGAESDYKGAIERRP
jgi:hypothetical protein